MQGETKGNQKGGVDIQHLVLESLELEPIDKVLFAEAKARIMAMVGSSEARLAEAKDVLRKIQAEAEALFSTENTKQLYLKLDNLGVAGARDFGGIFKEISYAATHPLFHTVSSLAWALRIYEQEGEGDPDKYQVYKIAREKILTFLAGDVLLQEQRSELTVAGDVALSVMLKIVKKLACDGDVVDILCAKEKEKFWPSAEYRYARYVGDLGKEGLLLPSEVKQAIGGKPLVDLGAGSSPAGMIYWALKQGASSVDVVDLAGPSTFHAAELLLSRIEETASLAKGKVKFAPKTDMLGYASKLPNGYGNFTINGIDSSIVKNQLYNLVLAYHLNRATPMGGVAFGHNSDILKYLGSFGFFEITDLVYPPISNVGDEEMRLYPPARFFRKEKEI